MKKHVKLIVVILILVIILGLIGILMLLQQLKNSNIEVDPPTEDETLIGTVDSNVEELKSTDKFYTVKACISQYYYYITEYFSQEENKQEYLSILYNLLDSRYTTEFNVTEENIVQKLNLQLNEEFQIKEVYTQKETLDITTYLVYGWLNNTSTKTSKDYGFMIQVDPAQKIFCIAPYEYMVKHKLTNPEQIAETSLSVEEIPTNNTNRYSKNKIVDENVAQDYLQNYLTNIVYHPEEAYASLDVEYKDKRFGSYEKFKQYISDNQYTFQVAKLNKYMVDKTGEMKEYVCVDQFGNYYIFTEQSIWNYTMQLDAYTITRESFVQEYNKSNEERKVALNIDKFFSMINAKDYRNAYTLLAPSYRQNYFPTEQSFKQYIQNNFFEYNQIEYANIEEQSGIYLQKIRITDKMEKSTNIVQKTIVMQLQDNFDFVLSFEY